MLKELYFVTTNPRKFNDIKGWLAQLAPEIELKQVFLELPELQSLDMHEVAYHKARHAFSVIQKPLIVDDSGLYLERYNNFPGPLSKYVIQGIGLEGFWLLAKDDPKVHFANCIVYIDTITSKLFEGITHGLLIEPKPRNNKDARFVDIFIAEGADCPFSQLKGTDLERDLHYRYKSLKQLVEFLKSSN